MSRTNNAISQSHKCLVSASCTSVLAFLLPKSTMWSRVVMGDLYSKFALQLQLPWVQREKTVEKKLVLLAL